MFGATISKKQSRQSCPTDFCVGESLNSLTIQLVALSWLLLPSEFRLNLAVVLKSEKRDLTRSLNLLLHNTRLQGSKMIQECAHGYGVP